jgi:RIO kinase 1
MSSERFLDDKQLKKLDQQIELMISKIGSDRKTENEVFDKSTLHTFEKLISDRIIDMLDFPISTGKEANIFRAITPDKKFVAVKVYRTSTAMFRDVSKYILGDPRFKSIHNKRKDIVYAWTKKEYKNLKRLEEIGVRAPKAIISINNVLVMQYIGSKNHPAPLLKDVVLSNPKEVFDTIIKFIFKMYKEADLVHADLSSYNILMYKSKPYIIDIGQGVLLEHPNSLEFLKRDIHNIVNYFKKLDIRADEQKIFNTIIKSE